MAKDILTPDKSKVLVDKTQLIETFVDAERLSMNPAETEKLANDYLNDVVSEDEFIKRTATSNTAQTIIRCISHLCDIKSVINDVRKNPDWNVDLSVSLRLNDEIIDTDEIFVVRCDLALSDRSILETSFSRFETKLREDDHTVIDIEATGLDTNLYPFSLVLPYKLLSGKVKEVSRLIVFLPEHFDRDVDVSIDELALIVTNKNTNDATTVAIEIENAEIEVRDKP